MDSFGLNGELMISGLSIEPPNSRPQVGTGADFADFNISCELALRLKEALAKHWTQGDCVALKIATRKFDATITGTVKSKTLYDHLRDAAKEVKVVGLGKVDMSTVNIDYGLTPSW